MLPSAHQERKNLPGVVRQRIKQAINELAEEPRPPNSIKVRSPVETTWEPRRMRIDTWRIIYAVDEDWQEIVILAIRKRPPYDYADLTDLLKELE